MKSLKKNFSLFIRLVMGDLQPNPLWQKPTYRIKFFLRSLLFYPETFFWVKKLAKYPKLDYFLTQQSNLPAKLQRPYLASNFSRCKQYKALRYHYDYISTLSSYLIEKLYGPYPTLLATLTGKDGLPLFIYIESNDKYAREGELTITVCNQDQIVLVALTFSIVEYQGYPALFIGGLQGSNHEDLKFLIQQATKIAYGSFPKTLALETLLVFADFLKIETLLAVSNQTHIYNNWRYRRRNKQRFADYNDYWETLHGKENETHYYQLPHRFERKSMESIASKKRSEYRKRYQLLDKLVDDIKQRLMAIEKNQNP